MSNYGYIPQLRFKGFDDNNAPLAGGKLYSYVAGTNTPLPLYVNKTGSPASNPVILNARGEAQVYMSDTSAYKLVLKDSNDVTIWTEDNVTTGGSSGSISGLDEKVKISGVDELAGFLNSKILAGDGIVFDINIGGVAGDSITINSEGRSKVSSSGAFQYLQDAITSANSWITISNVGDKVVIDASPLVNEFGKIKLDALDTLGYITDKLIAGTGITFTRVDDTFVINCEAVSLINAIADTATIDLDSTGGTLTANVKISSNPNNQLSVDGSGLLVEGQEYAQSVSQPLAYTDLGVLSVGTGSFATNVFTLTSISILGLVNTVDTLTKKTKTISSTGSINLTVPGGTFNASTPYATVYIWNGLNQTWNDSTNITQLFVQSGSLTPEDRRYKLPICILTSQDLTNISGITWNTQFVNNAPKMFKDFLDVVGNPKNGLAISGSGSNLSLNVGSGTIFGIGANADSGSTYTNSNDVINFSALTNASFFMATIGAVSSTPVTSIPVTQYNTTGTTLVSIPSNNWVNHRVFIVHDNASLNPNESLIIVQYGQATYANRNSATAAIGSESFTLNEATARMTFLGVITIQQNATLSNTATFTQATHFGDFGSASSGGAFIGVSDTATINMTDSSGVISADVVDGSIGLTQLNTASVDSRYVLKTGDTMTGNLNISNNTGGAMLYLNAGTATGAQIRFKGNLNTAGFVTGTSSTSGNFVVYNNDTATTMLNLDKSTNNATFSNRVTAGALTSNGDLSVATTSVFNGNNTHQHASDIRSIYTINSVQTGQLQAVANNFRVVALAGSNLEFFTNGASRGSISNATNQWTFSTQINGTAGVFSGNLTASQFIRSGGLSTQFLKADGSVDSNTYATTAQLGNYLPLAGGTLTGGLLGTTANFNTSITSGGNVVLSNTSFAELYFGPSSNAALSLDVVGANLRTYVGGSIRTSLTSSLYTLNVPLSGSTATFSGLISASTAPTLGQHLTNKTYVDGAISTATGAYLPLTGGTLSGGLNGTTASFSSTLGVNGRITHTNSNNTLDNYQDIFEFRRGDGSGVKAYIGTVGDGANGVKGISFTSSIPITMGALNISTTGLNIGNTVSYANMPTTSWEIDLGTSSSQSVDDLTPAKWINRVSGTNATGYELRWLSESRSGAGMGAEVERMKLNNNALTLNTQNARGIRLNSLVSGSQIQFTSSDNSSGWRSGISSDVNGDYIIVNDTGVTVPFKIAKSNNAVTLLGSLTGTSATFTGSSGILSNYLHLNNSDPSATLQEHQIFTRGNASGAYYGFYTQGNGAGATTDLVLRYAGADVVRFVGDLGTFTGRVVTSASTTTRAGFNITPGTAPTSPVNGDIWTVNANSGLLARLNGTTRTIGLLGVTQDWASTQTARGWALTRQAFTPTGTTQAITLSTGNLLDLILTSSAGNVTATLSSASAGAESILQVTGHASAARNVLITQASTVIQYNGVVSAAGATVDLGTTPAGGKSTYRMLWITATYVVVHRVSDNLATGFITNSGHNTVSMPWSVGNNANWASATGGLQIDTAGTYGAWIKGNTLIEQAVSQALTLYKPVSATNEEVCVNFDLQSSSGAQRTYAQICGKIVDGTNLSHDGELELNVAINGALPATPKVRINEYGVRTNRAQLDVTVTSIKAGLTWGGVTTGTRSGGIHTDGVNWFFTGLGTGVNPIQAGGANVTINAGDTVVAFTSTLDIDFERVYFNSTTAAVGGTELKFTIGKTGSAPYTYTVRAETTYTVTANNQITLHNCYWRGQLNSGSTI